MAIVLRKIFFYIEILIEFQKNRHDPSPIHNHFTKVKFLFEREGFMDCLMKMIDLSTLITKNRGINYKRSLSNEVEKLSKYLKKYGKEIDEYHYDPKRGFQKSERATNALIKGRSIYHKHMHEQGQVSITKEYERLSQTADVMNFECDDTICTNAQACQNQIKKLMKFIMSSTSKRGA